MTIQVTSGNSAILQSQVAQLLVQPLLQASTFLAAGPTVLESASPVRIPRIASGVSAGFVAEAAQISDGSITLDEIDLMPSTLKSLKVLVRVSNEMVRQSVVGLETVFQNTLVTDVATALDAALWSGSGSSNTVKGILNQSGVATGDLDITDIDSLIDGIATAMANKVAPTHWAMTSATFNAFRKIKVGTSDARYVFDPSTVQNGTAFQLLGLPVLVTDNVPDAAADRPQVALVDFSKVVVVRDIDASVAILDQTWGDYDSVGIRVVSRWDVGLLQPHAVTLLTTPAS
ncbi:phage major capsid protein [Mycobacterium colombiense]|uniref:phage major capsid protein n=1 Tax=Mycobacterium colombiense TaxID=339268 RepID=UPI002009ED62|nr:phage major capsid protein [Mycobacterium colombiense]MCK8644397.1 phage major capsid protein [Mycobacterium colombiense]